MKELLENYPQRVEVEKVEDVKIAASEQITNINLLRSLLLHTPGGFAITAGILGTLESLSKPDFPTAAVIGAAFVFTGILLDNTIQNFANENVSEASFPS